MRICIDIDGVIAQLKKQGQSYADIEPVPGAVEKIHALRQAGHYIILYTARHMRTCDGDVGKIVARQGRITLNWLDHHGIEMDEIYFGKPYADVYLDDKAVRFKGWETIASDGSNLPWIVE